MAEATSASLKARNTSWNTGDDIKLLGLIDQDRVDPHIEGTKANIEQIRAEHFPQIPYRNFRTLWIKKSTQYITNGTLNGANTSGKGCTTWF